MTNEEILALSISTRKQLLEELNNCPYESPRHNAIDNAVWALEDLEQFINETT